MRNKPALKKKKKQKTKSSGWKGFSLDNPTITKFPSKAEAFMSYVLLYLSRTEQRGTETSRRRRKSANGNERTRNVSPATASTATRVWSRFQVASTRRTKHRASFFTGMWQLLVWFLFVIICILKGDNTVLRTKCYLRHFWECVGNIRCFLENVEKCYNLWEIFNNLAVHGEIFGGSRMVFAVVYR